MPNSLISVLFCCTESTGNLIVLKNHPLFVLLLSLLSFSVSADEQDKDYTIITGEREVKLMFEQCSRMTPTMRTGYRKLDEATVKKIEAALPAALQKAAKGKSINIDDYKRQYGAFEHLRREMVYINGFHKEAIKSWAAEDAAHKALLDNWQNQAISVCGGDMNYWGVLYDGLNNQIVEVLFNRNTTKRR